MQTGILSLQFPSPPQEKRCANCAYNCLNNQTSKANPSQFVENLASEFDGIAATYLLRVSAAYHIDDNGHEIGVQRTAILAVKLIFAIDHSRFGRSESGKDELPAANHPNIKFPSLFKHFNVSRLSPNGTIVGRVNAEFGDENVSAKEGKNKNNITKQQNDRFMLFYVVQPTAAPKFRVDPDRGEIMLIDNRPFEAGLQNQANLTIYAFERSLRTKGEISEIDQHFTGVGSEFSRF